MFRIKLPVTIAFQYSETSSTSLLLSGNISFVKRSISSFPNVANLASLPRSPPRKILVLPRELKRFFPIQIVCFAMLKSLAHLLSLYHDWYCYELVFSSHDYEGKDAMRVKLPALVLTLLTWMSLKLLLDVPKIRKEPFHVLSRVLCRASEDHASVDERFNCQLKTMRHCINAEQPPQQFPSSSRWKKCLF